MKSMLKQQINLYLPFIAARPPTALLTWNQFWISQVLVLMLLIATYFYSIGNLFYLSKEQKQAAQSETFLQKKFYALKEQYPALFFSQNVAQTLNLMQKNIESEKKFLNDLTPHTPFSQKLLALSRVIVPNVWLTNIIISNVDQTMVLKGQTLSSEYLQSLLTNIAHENTFANDVFSVNNVENLNNKEGALAFEITIMK